MDQHDCKSKKDHADEPDPDLLAHHSQSWIRPVAGWKPQTHNCRRQFAALARRLFAEWPVPAFFDSVWFQGNGIRRYLRRAPVIYLKK